MINEVVEPEYRKIRRKRRLIYEALSNDANPARNPKVHEEAQEIVDVLCEIIRDLATARKLDVEPAFLRRD